MDEFQTTDLNTKSSLSNLATDSRINCKWSKVKQIGENYSYIRAITDSPILTVEALKDGFRKFPQIRGYLFPSNNDQNETGDEERSNDSNKPGFKPGVLCYGLNVPLKLDFKESPEFNDEAGDDQSDLGYASDVDPESESGPESRPSKRIKVSDTSPSQTQEESESQRQARRKTELSARFIFFHHDDSRVKHYAGTGSTPDSGGTSDQCRNLECLGDPYLNNGDDNELKAICAEQLPNQDRDGVKWDESWNEECFQPEFIKSLLDREKLEKYREIHVKETNASAVIRSLYAYRPDLTQLTDVPHFIGVVDSKKFSGNGIGIAHNTLFFPHDQTSDKRYHDYKRFERDLIDGLTKECMEHYAPKHSEHQD